MPSRRLTRVQQRERTRQRLLVAAASRIAEQGWAAIERELVEDGLPFRYRPQRFADGCEGNEGAFVATVFWLAQVYRMPGHDDDTHALFKRRLFLRNDVGLLAEEYDLKAQRMCGNFPFALAQVGLVNVALALQGDWRVDVDIGDTLADGLRRCARDERGRHDDRAVPRIIRYDSRLSLLRLRY